jgi:hypothetical protein
MTVGWRLRVATGIAALMLAVGCTSLDRPRVQPDVVPMASPMRTFDAAITSVAEELGAAVTVVGERLEAAGGAYRPSEPQSMLEVPRAILRVDLADPDDGFVVVYRASDAAPADGMAAELASHLGSGFGQTNYPADTRFSVAVVGDSVVFTSFSPGRSSDPERAQRAFEAIAEVGRAVEVVR